MSDAEIIAEIRAELFDRNTRTAGGGREWGVLLPAAMRRIDELEAIDLRPACLSVGELAGKYEELRGILLLEQPWPLRDSLLKLIEAAEILLNEKNYDGDGWEQIQHAAEAAKKALANWPI